MAKRVSMMELQQQRQEQLAREQQQRQEEQFGRLLEEQQQQLGKLFMKQQHEAEEQMGALQDDLRQTKEAMEGWLQATEESLEGMHRELTKRLQAVQESLRTELQEELRAELRDLQRPEEERRREPRPEARPSGLLRPSATDFIPSVTPLLTGTDGSVRRTGATQRPPLYNGSTSWDAYITQFEMLALFNHWFEMLALFNHWTEVEKATLLVVSLRGAALPVLSNLPADRRSDHRALVTALENHFGTAHQAELHRMKLRNQTRKRDESLAELMEDIERLARLAYPDAAILRDRIVCGINDDRIQQRLLSEKGLTYKKALELSQGLETAAKNVCELQSTKLEQPAQVHKVTPGRKGRVQTVKVVQEPGVE